MNQGTRGTPRRFQFRSQFDQGAVGLTLHAQYKDRRTCGTVGVDRCSCKHGGEDGGLQLKKRKLPHHDSGALAPYVAIEMDREIINIMSGVGRVGKLELVLFLYLRFTNNRTYETPKIQR